MAETEKEEEKEKENSTQKDLGEESPSTSGHSQVFQASSEYKKEAVAFSYNGLINKLCTKARLR